MTEDQKNLICNVILTHKYTAGDHIVNEGDDASSFYIIKEVRKIFSYFTNILLFH